MGSIPILFVSNIVSSIPFVSNIVSSTHPLHINTFYFLFCPLFKVIVHYLGHHLGRSINELFEDLKTYFLVIGRSPVIALGSFVIAKLGQYLFLFLRAFPNHQVMCAQFEVNMEWARLKCFGRDAPFLAIS